MPSLITSNSNESNFPLDSAGASPACTATVTTITPMLTNARVLALASFAMSLYSANG